MQSSHLPQVDFSPSRAMWIQRRFIGLLWFMKSELVVVAVLCSIKLLNQKHNGVVDNPQHPQTIHTWNRKQSTRMAKMTKHTGNGSSSPLNKTCASLKFSQQHCVHQLTLQVSNFNQFIRRIYFPLKKTAAQLKF